jgi:hypothetical protein
MECYGSIIKLEIRISGEASVSDQSETIQKFKFPNSKTILSVICIWVFVLVSNFGFRASSLEFDFVKGFSSSLYVLVLLSRNLFTNGQRDGIDSY